MQLNTKPKGRTNRVGVIEATDGRLLKYRAIWRENGKQCSMGFENYEDAVAFRSSIEKEMIKDYLEEIDKEENNERRSKSY